MKFSLPEESSRTFKGAMAEVVARHYIEKEILPILIRKWLFVRYVPELMTNACVKQKAFKAEEGFKE